MLNEVLLQGHVLVRGRRFFRLLGFDIRWKFATDVNALYFRSFC